MIASRLYFVGRIIGGLSRGVGMWYRSSERCLQLHTHKHRVVDESCSRLRCGFGVDVVCLYLLCFLRMWCLRIIVSIQNVVGVHGVETVSSRYLAWRNHNQNEYASCFGRTPNHTSEHIHTRIKKAMTKKITRRSRERDVPDVMRREEHSRSKKNDRNDSYTSTSCPTSVAA